MGQCQHEYYTDQYSSERCQHKAVCRVQFSYDWERRQEIKELCEVHSRTDLDSLNGWGKSHGHSAIIIVEQVTLN